MCLFDLAWSHSPCQTFETPFKRPNRHRWRPSRASKTRPPLAKIMSPTMCFTSRSLVIFVTSILMQKLGQSWNGFLAHQPAAGPSSTCLLLVICQSCSGESHQTDDAPKLTFSKLHLDLVTKTHPDQSLIHTVDFNLIRPWGTHLRCSRNHLDDISVGTGEGHNHRHVGRCGHMQGHNHRRCGHMQGHNHRFGDANCSQDFLSTCSGLLLEDSWQHGCTCCVGGFCSFPSPDRNPQTSSKLLFSAISPFSSLQQSTNSMLQSGNKYKQIAAPVRKMGERVQI